MFEKLKTKIEDLTRNLSALYLAYGRKDVSIYAKIIIIIAVAYAFSPIDLIPDFIPILGYIDDLLIIPFLIFIALKLIPKNIMDECREQAKDLWKNEKPRKWYYAILVIIIWLLIIFILIKSLRTFFSVL